MTEPKNMNDPNLKVGDTVKMEVPEPYNLGWIDINKELPKLNQKFLIYGDLGWQIIDISIGKLMKDGYYFFILPSFQEVYLENITHWQPLPMKPL